MSNFITRGKIRSVVNADFGAPRTFFSSINFDLSNSASQFIDTIDFSVFAQVADRPNVDGPVVQIYRNVLVDEAQSFDPQILNNSSVVLLWQGQYQRYGDVSFSKTFDAPRGFQLDNGFKYSVVAFTQLNAVIANAVLYNFFITGRVDVDQEGTLYGGIR